MKTEKKEKDTEQSFMRLGDSNTVCNLMKQWLAFIRTYLDYMWQNEIFGVLEQSHYVS